MSSTSAPGLAVAGGSLAPGSVEDHDFVFPDESHDDHDFVYPDEAGPAKRT